MKKITVTSARPLSDKQKKDIENTFYTRLKEAVDAEYKLSPDILGGIIVTVGDRVFDGSLQTELKKIKQILKQNTSKT